MYAHLSPQVHRTNALDRLIGEHLYLPYFFAPTVILIKHLPLSILSFVFCKQSIGNRYLHFWRRDEVFFASCCVTFEDRHFLPTGTQESLKWETDARRVQSYIHNRVIMNFRIRPTRRLYTLVSYLKQFCAVTEKSTYVTNNCFVKTYLQCKYAVLIISILFMTKLTDLLRHISNQLLMRLQFESFSA